MTDQTPLEISIGGIVDNPSESDTAYILHGLTHLKQRYDISRMFLQGFLRRYVADKKYDLVRRFHTWVKHCDKETCDSCLHVGDFGVIGDWMAWKTYNDDLMRGFTYTWQDLLEEVVDRGEDGDFTDESPIMGVTGVEFQEILIEQNFGHFTHDW